MILKNYRAKRNFKTTPEPSGNKPAKAKKNSQDQQKTNISTKTTAPKLLYVVQKHDASHLHYDFRLEMNGVLLSWAVPKGPSTNPAIKRLAVHVEDHPIEYGSFEGVIPEGQYGAGTVEIWDKGTWLCINESPKKSYEDGNLTFILKGKKLTGVWKLVQLKKSNNPKNWILFKVKEQ